jgi:Lrp/AsnC family leucine-responsive transcriptional regulator
MIKMVMLDDLDRAIIQLLMQDGRQSFRRLASKLNVSVPTVKSRYTRLVNLGVIKGVSAIVDASKLEGYVTALISLKLDTSNIDSIIEELVALDCVESIMLTTGEANMLIKVTLNNIQALEDFKVRLLEIKGVQIMSTQIITRVIKDEPVGKVIYSRLRLTCHYCKNSIAGEPFMLRVDGDEYYFCCRSCLRLFKEDQLLS